MAISVLICATALTDSDDRRALENLAEPSSVQAAGRLAHPADSGSVLAAHLMARVLVAESAALSVDSVALERRCPRCGSDGHGAPEARVTSGHWFVSIAHTRGFAAAAVSATMPVGIDAEAGDVGTVWSTIRDGMFSAVERDAVTRGESGLTARSLWTKKEAIAKLRRLEDGLELAGIDVGTGDDDWVSTAHGWVRALPAPEGVDVALAVPGPVPRVVQQVCDVRGLLSRAQGVERRGH